MKFRLSKLQVKILHALYTKGEDRSYELSEKVDDNNNSKERTTKLLESGFIFVNDTIDPRTGKTVGKRYTKAIHAKRLTRSKLLFIVNNWQEYNAYSEDASIAGICGWKKWQKGYPPFYKQQQVTFTRSIQTLAAAGYVDLLMRFEEPVIISNKKLAGKMGIETYSLKEERAKRMIAYKERYEKEKTKDQNTKTFEEWFTTKKPNLLGQYVSPFDIFTSNFSRVNFRKTHWVRLTEKGLSKAEELNVKYQTRVSELTIRQGVSI